MFTLLILLVTVSCFAPSLADVRVARTYVYEAVPGNVGNKVIGVIDFTQNGDQVMLNGSLSGLQPGPHGFHVHEKGDIGNGCLAAGAHFNPEHKNHGAPTDSDRHVGDLGNLMTQNNGETPIYITDSIIKLNGGHSIIGRAVVVHQMGDDMGKGGTPDSLTTGNSGARIACGVIGIVDSALSTATSLVTVLLLLFFQLF